MIYQGALLTISGPVRRMKFPCRVGCGVEDCTATADTFFEAGQAPQLPSEWVTVRVDGFGAYLCPEHGANR